MDDAAVRLDGVEARRVGEARREGEERDDGDGLEGAEGPARQAQVGHCARVFEARGGLVCHVDEIEAREPIERARPIQPSGA